MMADREAVLRSTERPKNNWPLDSPVHSVQSDNATVTEFVVVVAKPVTISRQYFAEHTDERGVKVLRTPVG